MAIGDIVSTLFSNSPATPQQPLPTLTPESIKRRRLLAEAMMKEGMDYSPVKSPWQGAARMVQGALGGWEAGTLDKQEREGTAAGAKTMADILAMEMNKGGAAPASAPATGAVGSGSAPGGSLPEDRIKMAGEYFKGQGYAPHQVAGIVGNLMQESGLNTGALNPRDGRDGSDSIGIAQWNGPRARAFQQFAASNNSDPKDFNTQLAFVNHELGTTESRVAQALKAAKNPAEAAAAFVGYERPAGWSASNPAGAHGFDRRVGYANRAAGLLGMGAEGPAVASQGAPVQVASADPGFVPQMPQQAAAQPPQAPAPQQMAQAPQQAPQAPQDPTADAGNPVRPEAMQQVAQAAASPQVQQAAQAAAQTPQGRQLLQQSQGAPLAAIMAAMANPWINDGQKAMLMMIAKEKMQQADPAHQLEMQSKRFAFEQAQANAPLERKEKELRVQAVQRGLEGDGAVPLTDDERRSYGIPRGQAAYKLRSGEIKFGPAGTTIKNEGSIPPGYQAKRDADGNVISVEAIPGSKEAQAEIQKKAGVKASANSVLDTITRIDKTMESTAFPTTGGIGNLMSSVPGTAAHDVRNLVDTLEANIAFDKLGEMRAASPTGGALGSITERELALLGASMASLKQSQSAGQFKENLSRVRERYLDIIHGSGNRPEAAKPADAGSIKPGHVEDGYRFKGGNPAKAESWEKVR